MDNITEQDARDVCEWAVRALAMAHVGALSALDSGNSDAELLDVLADVLASQMNSAPNVLAKPAREMLLMVMDEYEREETEIANFINNLDDPSAFEE